ncbi:IclR family transcriptional regulator [Pedobacter arcticus]|uniref:IclR family transcriptional regulator n=1 Tax=Pedobacter arcticus TaxID=752140 RepID=UPI00030ACC33|nr:IclR family transcriptional regulator C-terminal domain-containing protein [Pedobacter arcticus]
MQQAINRSFDILEYLAIDPEIPRSFSDIAINVGLNTGTCANIIKAMVKRGFLEKLDDKKGYLLGKKLYQLTSFDGYKKDLIQVAKPLLEKLTEKINENASLAVLKESSRILLHQTKSKQEIQATSSIDKPAYESSTGRLLLAVQKDAEIEKYLQNWGLPSLPVWKEAATKSGFWSQIEKIRKDNYVIQESQNQISGLSVAVFQKDKVIASICLYMPSFRLINFDKSYLISELQETAKLISSSL